MKSSCPYLFSSMVAIVCDLISDDESKLTCFGLLLFPSSSDEPDVVAIGGVDVDTVTGAGPGTGTTAVVEAGGAADPFAITCWTRV